MEEDEIVFPPERTKKSSKRVLRSSCIGSKCLCASKGLKHHDELSEDHNEHGGEEEEEFVVHSFPQHSTLRGALASSSQSYVSSSSQRITSSTTTFSSTESSRVFFKSSSGGNRSSLSPQFSVRQTTSSGPMQSSVDHSQSSYLTSSLGKGDSSSSFLESSSAAHRYKDHSPDTSSFSDSLDSPRHRLFKDFRSWINSPRTGYTYAESETYGSETESKNEVPMPHMARNPIHHETAPAYKTSKNVSFRVKRREERRSSSFFTMVKRFFRKVFYEIPASLLIFDTKLLLKSKQNILLRGLLCIWTLFCVTPVTLISQFASSITRLPSVLLGGIQRRTQEEVRIDADERKKPFGFKSLVNLRQSLAAASKRYRMKKLKEKIRKVHKKRKSYGPPTRQSRRLRGIPAEKYELPKKYRRRLKKKKSAMKKVQGEDGHLLSDAWYSFLSLFSLSSYSEDDDSETESSSDEESPTRRGVLTGLPGSKPNKIFYVPALILSYLRAPFDFMYSSYHELRIALAKRIFYLFDHEKDPGDSDSDSEDEDEFDDEDIEEFMERRYLIQDIVTYLMSLGKTPYKQHTPSSQMINTTKSSNRERSKIIRQKYTSGRKDDMSDTDSEVEITYTKISAPSKKPSISSRFRKKMSAFFSSSSENGPSKIHQTPGIVLSSDEEIISVIQAPKLYSSKKSTEVQESSHSWKDRILWVVLYPWNQLLSSLRFLRNELNIWTGGYRNAVGSKSKADGLFRRLGRSIYNGIRNIGLLIGSICICICLPFIHGARKALSLFSPRDEVDQGRATFEISEDECVDEGFDSLSDEELERKVLSQNMKIFSSELVSSPKEDGEATEKPSGKNADSRCRTLLPLFLLLLLLIPLCLFGLWPLMRSSEVPPSIHWISSKSAEYLDGAKVLQNTIQENGKSGWINVKTMFGAMSDSVLIQLSQLKDSLSSMSLSLSGGFSSYEKALRNHFSGALAMLSDFFTTLQEGLLSSCASFWHLVLKIFAWIRDAALYYYGKMLDFGGFCKAKSSSLAVQTGRSLSEALSSSLLLFSSFWRGGSSSHHTKSSSTEQLSPTPSLKGGESGPPKPSQLSMADYDIIVEKIISNEKFRELAKSSPDDELMESSKKEIIKIVSAQEEKLQKDYSELKNLLRQQKETLDAHQESYETWRRDIENIFQSLKTEMQGLASPKEEGFNSLLQELQDKILALEDNSLKLFNMSSSCCKSIGSMDIESRVRHYFQDSNGKDLLLREMREQFISKDENGERLAKLKNDVLAELESLRTDGSPDVDSVHRVVQKALIRYDADKTGKFDYAMESAGGSVISTRCTETYIKKTALYTLLGLPLWYPSNNPRTAIQPGVHPGECWAFKGSEGFLVIHLSNAILPRSFSIEHIPKSMSPTGSIDSAPKDFIVLGLKSEKDPDPVTLGRYSYSSTGDPLQSFDVQHSGEEESFDIIELNILSNHGNVNFTCLYRFRVHGSPINT